MGTGRSRDPDAHACILRQPADCQHIAVPINSATVHYPHAPSQPAAWRDADCYAISGKQAAHSERVTETRVSWTVRLLLAYRFSGASHDGSRLA
jgi:hypothetical protein